MLQVMIYLNEGKSDIGEVIRITNRQLEIVLYLNEIKKTTIQELADKFEVSKRTIMRDINRISSIGVPIHTQPGYQGGVSIPGTYKFQQSFFSPDEIEDLVLALHIIGNLRKRDVKSSILKKLELLVPELTFLKEQDFTEYLKVELFQEPLCKKEEVFRNINTALDEEVIVELEINKHKYRVAPLSYALRSSGLYLYASDGTQLFTFLVSDIIYCKTTDQSFDRENYQKFMFH
mgnify:CR=1 FL=1